MINRPVLIDSSAWIDFNHYNQYPKVCAYIDNMLAGNDTIYTTPVIMQEVLQGIKKDIDFRKKSEEFESYQLLAYKDQSGAAKRAADLYRKCREKGKTIRKPNDCLIALVCIEFELQILSVDRDFNSISEVFQQLKIVNL